MDRGAWYSPWGRESQTAKRLSTSIEYIPTSDISYTHTHTHTHTRGQNKDTKGQPVNHTLVRDIFVRFPRQAQTQRHTVTDSKM